MKATRSRGFSLVELMIAIALGLFLLATISVVFVNSSRSRDETERANRQIENGRYAMQVMGDDLRLAGFLAAFDVGQANFALPAAKPDPCDTTVAGLNAALPLHVQGYDGGAALGCIADVKAGTDIVVVRRAAGCVADAAGCSATAAGQAYFQASLCNNNSELASNTLAGQYRLDTDAAKLILSARNCVDRAPKMRYLVRIYFVANNDVAGDGIPTLKRAELNNGAFQVIPIAQGIENLQLEYGIDTNNDGSPDVFTADPDSKPVCAGAACVQNWANAITAKIHLLARNTTPSYGSYTDDKTYTLGLKADGTDHAVPAQNDAYRRHVYQGDVRFYNPSGRRETAP
jgi:type IV pilus assembly protein PilW